MRVKESEPGYRARLLYVTANGFVRQAADHQRLGRVDHARAKRADARMLRAQARRILEEAV